MSLIVAYARHGNMEEASELFEGLPTKWSWDFYKKPREALDYFDKRQEA